MEEEPITADQQLIFATNDNNMPEVKALLKKGANVNAVYENGMTSLMLSCYNRKVDIAKFLVEQGADVNVKDNLCRTALIFSCMGGQLEIVKFLIENGADVDAPNISSYLMPFKIPQLKEIIKSLLESEHVKNAIEDVLRQTGLSEAQKNQLLKQNCKTKEDCIKFIKKLSEIIKLYGKYSEIIHSSVHKTLDITLRINKFLGINTNFITKEELTEYNAMSTETQTQYRGAMYEEIKTNLKNTFAVLLAKNQVKNNLKTISKTTKKSKK